MHPITVVTLVAIIIAEKCDGLTIREIREKAVRDLEELGIHMPTSNQLDAMMEKELNNTIIEKDAKLIEKDRQLNNTLDKLSARDKLIGNLEKDLEILLSHSKRLRCPVVLRHSIEVFPIRFLSSGEDQNKIHSKLEGVMKSSKRTQNLTQLVQQLASAYSKKSEKEQETAFENAFKRLKKVKLNLVPCEEGFGKVIYDLNQEPKSDVALTIWKNSKSFWEPLSKNRSLLDQNIIKKLTEYTPEFLLQQIDKGEINLISENVCNAEQLNYTITCLKVKHIMKTTTSKRYKDVMWILYMSRNREIKELWQDIKTEWPTLKEHEQADRYCTQFQQLYDLVSVVDMHSPGVQPPENCEPSPEDFDNYIKYLSHTKNADLGFVAKTLITE